jgi:DNA-binding response OmpR family regulator
MTQVLVAEDMAAISLSLEDALVESGYTVAGPFNSGAAALGWLETHTPDLALLDLRLSDGPCIGVARLLRGRGVPTLIFSGETSPMSLPPDLRDLPWLGKPVSFDNLIAALHSLETTTQSGKAFKGPE